MNKNNVKIGKYVLCTDMYDNLDHYQKIGQITDTSTDETGVMDITIQFLDPVLTPWGLSNTLKEIKCDFYDFQNQFKILKFED